MKFDYPVILASKSPRRRELLVGLGIKFEVKTVPVDEVYPSEITPLEVPEFLAKKKVEALASKIPNALIIGADTVVILDNSILEKPVSKAQAANFLHQLSDQKHQVVTGVCLQYREKVSIFKEVTEVTFAPLSEGEITHYIESCQPMDKAGAYGIQEWIGMIGVSRLEGCYYNVVGLPVHKLYQELNYFRSGF